jgi:hypothetical protein
MNEEAVSSIPNKTPPPKASPLLKYNAIQGVERSCKDKINNSSTQKSQGETEEDDPAICRFIGVCINIVADGEVVLG